MCDMAQNLNFVAGRFCEPDNSPSGSMKGEELLDQLSDCQYLRRLCYTVISSKQTCETRNIIQHL
jgi:hypothetical protein